MSPDLINVATFALIFAVVSSNGVKPPENGQLIIIRNGVKYDVSGRMIK